MDDIMAAVKADTGRPSEETEYIELLPLQNEITSFINHLDSWSTREKVGCYLVQALDKAAYIQREPLGIILVISPWNYPLLLSLMPLVGALGAGNCAVIKPSELAPHSAALLRRLLGSVFPRSLVRVEEGGAETTGELLRERFDHVFFTGSGRVGVHVMTAAARHLTPVTLELGGKCPVIVDALIGRLDIAVKRITWGKFITCGQTCIAPDHIICFEEDLDRIISRIRVSLIEFYGNDAQQSKDYSRVINQAHFQRLTSLLNSTRGRLALGGGSDEDILYMEPTVITHVEADDPLMDEEIFGPILPVLVVRSREEAVELVERGCRGGRKPLALYVFSDSDAFVDDVLRRTSSGGVTVNDVLFHKCLDTLPFGGVGSSGMGRYQGRFSFDTFSHHKAVLHRRFFGESSLWMRYPPYTASKLRWAREILKNRRLPNFPLIAQYLVVILIGALIGYILPYVMK